MIPCLMMHILNRRKTQALNVGKRRIHIGFRDNYTTMQAELHTWNTDITKERKKL